MQVISPTNQHVSTVVKHSKIQTLQSKNSPTNDADWESILELVLLGKTDEENETFKDIEAVATVSDDAITISIRKKIEGIIVSLPQFLVWLLLTPCSNDSANLLSPKTPKQQSSSSTGAVKPSKATQPRRNRS
jgi:hypothetical protein